MSIVALLSGYCVTHDLMTSFFDLIIMNFTYSVYIFHTICKCVRIVHLAYLMSESCNIYTDDYSLHQLHTLSWGDHNLISSLQWMKIFLRRHHHHHQLYKFLWLIAADRVRLHSFLFLFFYLQLVTPISCISSSVFSPSMSWSTSRSVSFISSYTSFSFVLHILSTWSN